MVTMVLLTTVSQAHTGNHETGFSTGLLHPISGWDHLAALLALGIFLFHSRSAWVSVSLFFVLLLVGFTLGLLGMSVPILEPVLIGTVFAGAALLLARIKVGMVCAVLLSSVFGLVHGNAHGLESGSQPMLFLLGFFISSFLLTFVGCFVAKLQESYQVILSRLIGAAALGVFVFCFVKELV